MEVSYATFNITLQARFAAATITNIDNKMLALIKKHHTLDQWSAAVCKRCQSLCKPVTQQKFKKNQILMFADYASQYIYLSN